MPEPKTLDFAAFMAHPFIQTIKDNQQWTISTGTKMPIDIPYLETCGIVIGASFANGNQPLVSLAHVQDVIENKGGTTTNNAAYNLKQGLDSFFILDIEPDCPEDVRNELLRLPYAYGEYSMSGQGFHLAFPRPDQPPVKRPELFTAKPVIKEEHGWYEFLLNHYVTFTGNMVCPADGTIMRPIDDLWAEFDRISENTKIIHTFELENGQIPELEDIELGEFITDLLTDENCAYRKTIDDFNGDASKYEFGVTGFYHKRMNSLLSTSAYEKHTYTPEERIRILYEVIIRMIPYRKKHEELREGMPWLMYTAKRVVTSVPQGD